MKKLKHYRIYNIDFEDNYEVCLEHPKNDNFSLCGVDISETPNGEPEETSEKINCKWCLDTIKTIKELNNV